MELVTDLSISTNEKEEAYNSILVFVKLLIRMVHLKLIKTSLDVPRLAEIIINVVIKYYGLLYSIMSDQGSLFT